jgi:hypothetical protein
MCAWRPDISTAAGLLIVLTDSPVEARGRSVLGKLRENCWYGSDRCKNSHTSAHPQQKRYPSLSSTALRACSSTQPSQRYGSPRAFEQAGAINV